MQIHNPQEASGISVQKARKPRLWMTFTVSGLLIAGCAVLVGQPGNAQSEGIGDASLVVTGPMFESNAARQLRVEY